MSINFKNLEYGLLSLFIIEIFTLAIFFVISYYSKKNNNLLSQIERYSLSLFFLVLILSLFAVIECFSPLNIRRAESVIFFISLLILFIKFGDIKSFNKELKIILIIQFIFCSFLIFISSLNYEFKYVLIDGPYVNKESVISTRIQYLSGDLPADNSVSYVVQEYLARNVSFQDNDPILPGQSVTNRPILLSLVTLPIRILVRPIESTHGDIPKFKYLDKHWPDFRIFTRDEKTYSVFLAISIFLNSFLFVSCALFAIEVYKFSGKMLIAFGLLYCSSSYIFIQTIFAWPKSIAGCFIILSVYVYLYRKNFFFSGILIGIGYLFHPYVISYILCSYLVYMAISKNLISPAKYTLGMILPILPWLIWSKFFLDIPSDLIEQNFRSLGNISEALIIRINNLNGLISPAHLGNININFFNMYPQTSHNLIGSIGSFIFFGGWILFLMPTPPQSKENNFYQHTKLDFSKSRLILVYLLLSCLLLTLVFSYPALPIVHGFQPLIPFILMLCVFKFYKSQSAAIVSIIYLQILFNFLHLLSYLCIHILSH